MIHDTTSRNCPCQPFALQVCPECADDHTEACWRCDGEGVLPCPDPDAYDGPFALIFVHRDLPGQPALEMPNGEAAA